MADDNCPLNCQHLIICIWGGYKCSKYNQGTSEHTNIMPKKLPVCLRAGADGAKETSY